MYADDSAITIQATSNEELQHKLNESLHLALNWMVTYRLTLNLAKTKAMIFGSRYTICKVDDIGIILNNEAVKFVTEFKYLGVIFENTLSFTSNVVYLKKKLIGRLKFLGKLCLLVGEDVSLQLYKSLILPAVDYADVIYNCLSE